MHFSSQLKMELDAYREAHTEIILYISQVETIVQTKLDSDERLENPKDEHEIAKVNALELRFTKTRYFNRSVNLPDKVEGSFSMSMILLASSWVLRDSSRNLIKSPLRTHAREHANVLISTCK